MKPRRHFHYDAWSSENSQINTCSINKNIQLNIFMRKKVKYLLKRLNPYEVKQSNANLKPVYIANLKTNLRTDN